MKNLVPGLLAFIVCLVTTVAFAQQNESPPEGTLIVTKMPLPSAEAIETARRQVRLSYASDFKQAKAPDQRWQLAARLAKEAERSQDDLEAGYALAMEAVDLYVGEADVLSAFKSVDKLGETFEFNVIAVKADLFKRASKEAKSPPVKRKLALSGLKLASDAAAAEQYSAASELAAALTTTLARPARDVNLAKRATELQARMGEMTKLAQKVAEARETLKTDATDATANELVGRYLCLTRQKWDEGLPYLAQAADANLKRVAELDLQAATDAAAQRGAADAWWELADKKSARETERPQLMSRAAHWYELSLANVTGLERIEVEKRLDAAYAAMSGRNFDKLTAIAANGLQAKGPVDCAAQSHVVVLGKGFDSQKSWLISLQFKPPSFERVGFSHHLLCWGGQPGFNPLYVTQEANRLHCIVVDEVNRGGQGLSANLNSKLVNQWIDIKFVHDAATQEYELYVNRRLVDRDPATVTARVGVRVNCVLGGTDDPDEQRFLGQIRDVWFGNIK